MESKTIHILSTHFMNFESGQIVVGGIQSYIKNLAEVAHDLGFKVNVYDFDIKGRIINLNTCSVIGCKIVEDNNKNENIAKFVKTCLTNEDDLVIYDSDDRVALKTTFSNVICLQHGISWDMPDDKQRSLPRSLFGCLIRDYQILHRLNRVQMLVCVDYNFVNWYRTFIKCNRINLKVIPNFTQISPLNNKPTDKINIIFARRFRKYRGVVVFTNAIIRLLKEYKNINVYFYGHGPEECWIHNQVDAYDNVFIDEYSVGDSLSIHTDKHIAVVPTVGSEGTSLSLLEAMSAQCAVVCSDVGGMTNIVLDGFNGKMVPAGDEEALYQAIKYLIENPEERDRLAHNGYETVKQAFSYERWKSEWENILKNYL